MNNVPNVVFFEVKGVGDKKEVLSDVAWRCFIKKQRILFVVQGEPAEKYLDQLLWSFPAESFLPHKVVHSSCDEPVAITSRNMENWNKADVIFNLNTEPIILTLQCKTIHELLDLSDPEKEAKGRQRLDYYLQHGMAVTCQPWGQKLNDADLI